MADGRERCHVLVADDDAVLRKLIVTMLRRQRSVDITEASNGEQAIEHLARGEAWQVLVLDLMMPTVSGWDVIDWLSANRDRAPKSVIVVSAADRTILQKIDPAVVNAIIFKPFDVHQLGAYVKSACALQLPDRRKRRVVREPGAARRK
jgi:CheY-like chemotaxis protein